MLAECQRALPALRVLATSPASANEVMAILGRRFALYPQPARSDGEWSEWWADYLETLKAIPAPAIEAGMAAYVRLPDSEFFPKPGRIAALAAEQPNDAAKAYSTAAWAIQAACPRVWVPAPVKTPAEIEAEEARHAELAIVIQRMAKETVAALKTAERPRPAFRAPQAKTDETGISAEMRALIAARTNGQSLK